MARQSTYPAQAFAALEMEVLKSPFDSGVRSTTWLMCSSGCEEEELKFRNQERRVGFDVGYPKVMSKREQLVFEQAMIRYRPGIHQRDRTNKVFLEGRRVRSRSMVAVTLRCRVNGNRVTQGWAINRRGCGCATWVCCGSEGEGETAGLWVVKGRSDEGRRSTTVEEWVAKGLGGGGTGTQDGWARGGMK